MKILLVDLETAPAQVYSWGVYDQTIPINHIIHYPYLLCWSAKWLGGKKILSDALINYPQTFKKDIRDDSMVVKSIWKLLDECDIAIAHNGDEFDFKKLNSFFLKNKMAPPSPFRTVDTKKVSRGNLGFISNKLDSLGKELEIGQKLEHTGMSLWTRCMAGDKGAWRTMLKYNAQDVRLLEELYLTMLPYTKNHPDSRIYLGDETACPKCRSSNTQRRGVYVLQSAKYQRYQCQDCGGWFKGDRVKKEIVRRAA